MNRTGAYALIDDDSALFGILARVLCPSRPAIASDTLTDVREVLFVSSDCRDIDVTLPDLEVPECDGLSVIPVTASQEAMRLRDVFDAGANASRNPRTKPRSRRSTWTGPWPSRATPLLAAATATPCPDVVTPARLPY